MRRWDTDRKAVKLAERKSQRQGERKTGWGRNGHAKFADEAKKERRSQGRVAEPSGIKVKRKRSNTKLKMDHDWDHLNLG